MWSFGFSLLFRLLLCGHLYSRCFAVCRRFSLALMSLASGRVMSRRSAMRMNTLRPVLGTKGSAWFYLGPVWMSNNVGAASFWRDYDAQTRYKHLSGQKEVGESFRALTNTQRSLPPKEELCPTLVQARPLGR